MSSVIQNAFYIGNNFNAILYGLELAVYILTIRALRRSRRKSSPGNKFLFAFSTVLLYLNTIFVATEAVFGEEMWIVNTDFPGGQDAYLVAFSAVWYQTLGTAASILLNLLSDALLIYRCYFIWGSKRIVLFPSVLWLATLALGIAQLAVSGAPGANYFAGLAQTLGTAYTSTLIALEVLVTALICARLLRRAPGAARRNAGGAAVLVESMAASTLCGIAYLVPFAMGSDVTIFFLSIYVMSTCLAPMMLILRMAGGNAWTLEAASKSWDTSSEGERCSGVTQTGGDTTVVGKDEEAGYVPTASENV